jgi:Tfp pilus assembly protein PilF
MLGMIAFVATRRGTPKSRLPVERVADLPREPDERQPPRIEPSQVNDRAATPTPAREASPPAARPSPSSTTKTDAPVSAPEWDWQIAQCREALRANPGDVRARNALAAALTDKGEFDEAIAQTREAIRLAPDFAPAHNNLAWALATHSDRGRRDDAEALVHARRAVSLAPDRAEFQNTLGLVELRNNHLREAESALRNSMEKTGGGSADDWFPMAILCAREGRRVEARKWLGQAAASADRDQRRDVDLLILRAEAAEVLARPIPGPVPGEAAKDAVQDSDAGFRPLFNGRDLTGWKVFPGEPNNWRVEQGRLVGGGRLSYLFTERGDYQDFHFRVEARISNGGNSGQFFRAEFAPRVSKGYEAQIGSTCDDPQRTGSLYNLVPVREMLVPPNAWFTQEVIARGNHIVIKVDGKTTADYRDPRSTYTRGHLALQQHHEGSVVEFRKIEVKELPIGTAAMKESATPAPRASGGAPTKRQAEGPKSSRPPARSRSKPRPLAEGEADLVPLYTGGNPLDQGWVSIGSGAFRADADGALTTQGWGLLFFDAPFKDFTLRLEFQVTDPTYDAVVYFRIPKRPRSLDEANETGYSAMIHQAEDGTGVGSVIWHKNADKRIPRLPIGQWQTYEITARDKTYTIKLNGALVNTFVGEVGGAGYVGIRGEGDSPPVRFRNIFIQRLRAAETASGKDDRANN